MEQLGRRKKFLKEIADRHRDLEQYLWRTKDGRYMLVHDMDDSHLKNAVSYTMQRQGHVPFVLQQEYFKRFGDTLPESANNGEGTMLKAGKRNRFDWDKMFEEHPF